jgi:REP element-mobilizing transposase RayT
MSFQHGGIYHVYNQGNNRQAIFFSDDNYRFFIRKIKNEICPYVDILAYCLMPNHYHLMVRVKDDPEVIGIGRTTLSRPANTNNPHPLHRKLGSLQSSYTRAINRQENRSGSLFRQQLKIKCLTKDDDYLFNCFNYIHQNPYVANLVNKIERWPFSSFSEYQFRSFSTCNGDIAYQYIRKLSPETFYSDSYKIIPKIE